MGVTVTERGPDGHRTFFVTVQPTRADWPQDRSDDEERALEGHADRLALMTARGLCVVAGPCLHFQLGIAVYDGLTLDEVLAEVAGDPMVVAGYFDAEVSAMRLTSERFNPSQAAAVPGAELTGLGWPR